MMQYRKSLLFLVALFCSIYFVTCAQEKFNSPQIRNLQKLAKDSPVIKFNSDLYKAYVLDTERNYSMFVLFTANHHKYKCGPCRSLSTSFHTFAESYERFFGKNYYSDEFLQKPFFLGEMEPDEAMDIFQQYGFTTVPHFAYIPASKGRPSSIAEGDFYRNTGAQPEDFAAFIHSKIGVEVTIYVSPLPQILGVITLVALTVLAFKVSVVIRKKMNNPMTWFFVTMGLYFIVMAGIAYNFIRSPPFSDTNPHTGQITYISPQARSQYVAEGFIIATLMTSAGLLLVGIGDVIPRMKSASRQRFTFWCACACLFMVLVLINNIFFAKYHLPAFRIHSVAGLLGR